MKTAVRAVLMVGVIATGVPGVLLMRACKTLADAARRWA